MKFPSFHPVRTTLVLIVLIGGAILFYFELGRFN